MKNLLWASLLLLCACKSQITTVTSTNLSLAGDSYIHEDDTVKITYSFWYQEGYIKFSLYNKLNVPLYIDWKNSSVIMNGARAYYWKDVVETQTKSATGYGYYGSASASRGTSYRKERVTAIPPRATVTRADYAILRQPKFIPNGTFTASTSANVFRNYIYCYTNEGLSTGQHLTDDEFYISNAYLVKKSKVADSISHSRFYINKNRSLVTRDGY